MSGSIQSGRVNREDLRSSRVSRSILSPGKRPAARRSSFPAARLIGKPIDVTLPVLKDIRWRYCSRWDEKPAAHLGKSLLRLGICRSSDWTGSAVDFVECGFKRFCQAHGSCETARVWQGDLRIMDHEFELTEQERQQVIGEMESPPTLLHLVGDYSAAASIPFGPTWSLLQREYDWLPAAFYVVFVENLWKWMRVYDYRSALEHAEMWMEEMEPEELKDSIYPGVAKCVPTCLRKVERLSYSRALRLLASTPRLRSTVARDLVLLALKMREHGKNYEHAWPGKLAEQIPPLEDFLNDADGCGPGCVITWNENDEISACFDEEMSTLGQNGPMEPSIMLPIDLAKPDKDLCRQVEYAFDYAAAMLKSLACAARAVEIIREIYDEHLGKHRLKSRVPVEQSALGLRQK